MAFKYSIRYLQIFPKNGEKLKIAAISAYCLGQHRVALHYARQYFQAGNGEIILNQSRRYHQLKFPYDPDIVQIIAECAWELGLIEKKEPRREL